MLRSPRACTLAAQAIRHLQWLAQVVPPRVHMANIRLHLNGWHTSARYQRKPVGRCLFCRNPKAEDRIEHIFRCPAARQIMPDRLKSGTPSTVLAHTWRLFYLEKQDQLVMALYVHAMYTMYNLYRHIPDRGEFRQSVERLVLEIHWKDKHRRFLKIFRGSF